jgi:uncharacterized repeat protein (TIGR01451 family)
VRKAISLALLGTIAVAAMALAGASSAAGPGIGPSTALGAGPSHVRLAGGNVVKQTGRRNYAGPNCPGRAWNCTTSMRVLQVSSPGGQNLAECVASSPIVTASPGNCVIDQSGGGAKNSARCTQTSTAVQYCKITQSGGENYASVSQSISQTDGFPQFGSQAAEVIQTGSVTNQLQLSQSVSQSTKTGSTQVQDAYQSAEVEQTATGAGWNLSQVNQSQLQKAYARSTNQSQNAGSGTSLPDCVDVDEPPGAPSKPNSCADVKQDSDDGKNENHLRQSISEDMNSTGPATQVQGSPEGGLEGHVHQHADTNGTSINEVRQSKALKQTVPKGSASSQTQTDPISCCGFFSQDGGSGNTETISQSSSLSASAPGATQSTDVIGTSNTDGTCQVSQTASINNQTDSNSANFTPCPFLTVTTSCSGSGSEGGCDSPDPVLGQPDSAITVEVRNLGPNGDNLEAPWASTTSADNGDVLVYRVIYSNSGTAAAHNVTLSTAGIPPSQTALTDAFLLDDVTASMYCPQTLTPTTCTLGPASDPGTVAPGTDPLFTTMYFAVQVTGFCGSTGAYTATGNTDEDGTITSAPPTVVDLFDCPG